LQSWFTKELSHPDLPETGRARLKRLATDWRMRVVAQRLAKEEKRLLGRAANKHTLADFMAQAARAPAYWQNLKKRKRGSSRRKELSKIKRACDRFCNLLQANKETATWAIDSFRDDGDKEHRDPTEVFSSLIATIQKIGHVAESDFDEGDWDHGVWVLPRKMLYRKAQEVFCILYIVDEASLIFGKPLYKEVAILVTVLLGLDEEISSERVKELWKSRMRGDSGIIK